MSSERTEKLLEEIRDLQKENAERYKEISKQQEQHLAEARENVRKGRRFSYAFFALLLAYLIALIFFA